MKGVNTHMNKNAYEIRLDVLIDAHEYCMRLFEHKFITMQTTAEKKNGTLALEDIEKIYPTRDEILDTAELFYAFVQNTQGSHGK